ncbi:MAG: O-antigen ligase family protein [Candidatus Uhrbacteria bacterium]|nr:O-antigen ligase family protein [Candidatus Uhrbacteria bacterium]
MIQEFLGKPFRFALLGFAGLFLLSMVGYFLHSSLFILGLLGLVTLVATFRKLEYGLMIAFLELLSNAHGYILYDSIGSVRISARMTIFLGLFLGWGLAILLRRTSLQLRDTRYVPFLVLALAIGVGGMIGLTRRSTMEVFQDGNAYLYLAYLVPIINVQWDSLKQRVVLQILAAATVFTTAMSLFILYAFTHLSQSFLRVMYVYLRDIRFAEMTNIGMGMYRIFEQTQVFAVVFGFILLERVYQVQSRKDRCISIALLSVVFIAILVGMSRSFLFGFIAAMLILGVWLVFGLKTSLRNWLLGIGSIIASIVIAIALIYSTVIFPFPHTRAAGEYLTGVFGERAIGTDVAVSSRWNLLHPMLDLIKADPILGNGFGQTVTFITDDPRIRAIHPDGSWTTTSMEWGWLELWLKMGILAPLGFLAVFAYTAYAASSLLRSDKAWVGIWILEFMTFLYFTHFFSPYLNHPIGLGLILLAIVFVPIISVPGLRIRVRAKQKMPRAELATSIATSRTK